MPSLDDCTQSWQKRLNDFVDNLDADVVGNDLKKKAEKNVERMFEKDKSIFDKAYYEFTDMLDDLELIEEYDLEFELAEIVDGIVDERGKKNA